MTQAASSLSPFFRIAAVAVGAMIVGVLALAIPVAAWSPAALAAAGLLVAGGLALGFLPAPRPRQATGDASAIWLIAPTGGLLLAWIALSGAGLVSALAGLHTLAWVLNCVCVGGFVASYALLHAATRIVEGAAAQVALATLDARSQWAAQIRHQVAQSEDEAVRRMLETLLERLRYAANDHPAQPAPENAEFQALLATLPQAAQSAEQLRPFLSQAEGLLEQREHNLRASRSQA